MSTNEKPEVAAAKSESIREWYDRTTRKWRKGLWVAAAATLCVMGIAYALLDTPMLARLQTFNGALTIPLWGGLWILSFIFMFLIPSREASFRGQEALESSFALITSAINDKVAPAMTEIKSLAKRVDSVLNEGVVSEFRTMLKTMNETASALRDTAAALKESALKVQGDSKSSHEELKKTAEEVRKFTAAAHPAIETFKRLEAKLEGEIATGLLDAARAAMESVRNMSLPSSAIGPTSAMPVSGPGPQLGAPAVAKQPDLDRALKLVSKKEKAATAPSAPPAEKPPVAAAAAAPAGTPVRVPLAVVPANETRQS